MRPVKCYECGKRYDFDTDDFCPKCGAFNPPSHTSRIGADGKVVRVDGLNERNHKASFVHAELHEENRERRFSGLAKNVQRTTYQSRGRAKGSQPIRGGEIIKWIIFAIIGINVLSGLLSALF